MTASRSTLILGCSSLLHHLEVFHLKRDDEAWRMQRCLWKNARSRETQFLQKVCRLKTWKCMSKTVASGGPALRGFKAQRYEEAAYSCIS